MKRFLQRLFLFLLPLLVVIALTEYLLRKIPNDYAIKARAYKEYGPDLEILVLGNSHAFYDINPAFFTHKTFNGGHVAQSLDLDAAIFEKFGEGLTKLKYVIIPVSDMSFFFKLANSAENWRIKNYSIYYDLYTTNQVSDYFEVLNLPFSINRKRLISYYIKNESNITETPLGFGTNFHSTTRLDLNETALKARQVHTIKTLENFSEEKMALEQIITACNNKNIAVILFIPPAYHTYSTYIDSLQLKTTINTCGLFTQKHKNVYYFNLLNDSSFTANDYYDADHLNEIGAQKLSLQLNAFIKQLDQSK